MNVPPLRTKSVLLAGILTLRVWLVAATVTFGLGRLVISNGMVARLIRTDARGSSAADAREAKIKTTALARIRRGVEVFMGSPSGALGVSRGPWAVKLLRRRLIQ